MESLTVHIDVLGGSVPETSCLGESKDRSAKLLGLSAARLKALTGTSCHNEPRVPQWALTTDFPQARVANLLRDYVQPNSNSSLEEVANLILALLPVNAPYSAEVCSVAELAPAMSRDHSIDYSSAHILAADKRPKSSAQVNNQQSSRNAFPRKGIRVLKFSAPCRYHRFNELRCRLYQRCKPPNMLLGRAPLCACAVS